MLGVVNINSEVPMTKKADFNAEEWSKVVEGPLLAGIRVITADRGGTIRESLAMGQVYAHARQQQGASELLDELVATPPPTFERAAAPRRGTGRRRPSATPTCSPRCAAS